LAFHQNTRIIETMAPSIKLTYFDIEGVAEPIRLALLLAGVEFDDVRVKFPEWPALKAKTPYQQLPVIEIDGGEMKAQSGAMLRYCGTLGDKSLYPSEKLYEIEEALGLITDLNNAFVPALSIGMRPATLGHPDGFQNTDEGKKLVETMRTSFIENLLPKFMGYIEAMLEKSGGDWLVAGEKPTIADCFAVPNIRRFSRGYIDYIPATSLNDYPKVVAYLEKFCSLPEIQGRYTDGIGAAAAAENN
jgi:prostaglandin-H2 D-isomerase / glutathione transferase